MNIVIALGFVGYLMAGLSPLEDGHHNSPAVEGKPSKLILFHIENQHLTPLEGVFIATSTDTFVTDTAGNAAVPVSWVGIGEAPSPHGFFIVGPSVVNSAASLSLSVDADGEYRFSLYDLAGRMLYSRSAHLAYGVYGLSVSLPRSGIYYLVVRSRDGVLEHRLINFGSSGLALEISSGAGVFRRGGTASKSDTSIEFTIWDTLRHIEDFPMDTVIGLSDSVSDTVEVELRGSQYWNVDFTLLHPNGERFHGGQAVFVNGDTLSTDSTGGVSFRDYGLSSGFDFRIQGDSAINLDTTVQDVRSDTAFSFVAPQNIVVNLPSLISFPEDSSMALNLSDAVHAPYGYDSVEVSHPSDSGVITVQMEGDSVVIQGVPDASGSDRIVLTVFGSEGTMKQDTVDVYVEPMTDIAIRVVNSDLTELTDFDSVRVDVDGNSYVFNPDEVLHLQFHPNDTVDFYIGGYQGDSLGSFVSHYYQIIPENDVNDTTLARIFPYENFRRSDYYGNAIAPKDSLMMFFETAIGPRMATTVDFDHVDDSLPPYFPVPPENPHGMKIIIFRNVNRDVFPHEDGTSLTQEQVDSIIYWITDFFSESNSMQNMPEIIVADVLDSTDWYQYFQQESCYVRPHPGEIIIEGSDACNAYAAYNEFNDNAQGYIYRGGASVDVYNLVEGTTMEEFLTALIIPL